MSTWKDYPRTKDSVAIVGFAASRDLAPYEREEFEIWGLNEEYNYPWMKRYDRWFQMHQEWDFNRSNNANHPNHIDWLKNESAPCRLCNGKLEVSMNKQVIPCPNCKASGTYVPARRTDFPIYMQKQYDYIPGSVEYPLKEVTDTFLPRLRGRHYFRSSAAFMLPMAMLLGFRRIWVYGFEMGMNTEYHYQRPNFEYLVGVGHGMGIEIDFPDVCTLLKGPMYGYEEAKVGLRQNFELRKLVLETQIQKRRDAMMKADGATSAIDELLTHTDEIDLQKELRKNAVEFSKATAMYNFVRGAKREVENLIAMHDKYFLGNNDVVEYDVQENNVKVEYVQEA